MSFATTATAIGDVYLAKADTTTALAQYHKVIDLATRVASPVPKQVTDKLTAIEAAFKRR